jgi:Immunity protein 42
MLLIDYKVNNMIFGNFEKFALEAEILKDSGTWTYGKLRFWINGISIGDFEDCSDLASSARWCRTFLDASPRRIRNDLDNAPAADVYELLYGRFVQSVSVFDAVSSKPWQGEWDRDPYVLDDVGESSLRDKFTILVIRKGDGLDRIIVYSCVEKYVFETILPQGDCDLFLAEYCIWIEDHNQHGRGQLA